jgi:hypothetical protein
MYNLKLLLFPIFYGKVGGMRGSCCDASMKGSRPGSCRRASHFLKLYENDENFAKISVGIYIFEKLGIISEKLSQKS